MWVELYRSGAWLDGTVPDNFATIWAMKISLLVLDGVFDTGLSSLLDAFTTANELAAAFGHKQVHFDVTLTGMRSSATTSQGLSVALTPTEICQGADWVVIPAIGYKMPGPLVQALQRHDVRDAGDVLRARAGDGGNIAAACIGTFVLAETGLLDGHQATTTWWLSQLFRQRYTHVDLDETRMLVHSGKRLTAGAALSHMDMALWLIRQASPELAVLTARYLIVDARATQSAYVISDHLSHADPLVAGFERWARAHLTEGFSLDAAAAELATSKRTLTRRVRHALGKSPLSWFQDLRVNQAVHLLKTTHLDMERIATATGYANGVTLRTLLRRRLGQGVREIRGSR